MIKHFTSLFLFSSVAFGNPEDGRIVLNSKSAPAPVVESAESISLSIAAHSISGSYQKMLGELIGACSDERFNLSEAPGISGGGTGNLEALANNKSQAAFVRSDVFTAIAQADSGYKRFKTLVTLYPEPVHILVLRDSKTKKKGMVEFGKQQFNSLVDLRGFTVAGGGGTVYTLKILKGQGGGDFSIAQYEDSKAMIKALDDGKIDAAAFVGAAPLPNVMGLDKSKYKLIPIGDTIVDKVKGIYKTTTVNYPGLSEGPVHTISSLLVILTRNFSTAKKIAAQKHFRQCFYKHLDHLKDEGSPAWQTVEASEKGVLDWYDIP